MKARRLAWVLIGAGFSLAAAAGERQLAEGLVYQNWKPPHQPSIEVHLLRIHARKWKLQLIGEGTGDGSKSLTARQWAQQKKLVAVINAGMFHPDQRHVGYMRVDKRSNNDRFNHYQSLAVFGAPKGFYLFDLDADVDAKQRAARHPYVVQNLRLIKKPGENRWPSHDKKPQPKRWSEAALAMDADGNAVFVFCRAALSMHDFNRVLLAHPWKIRAAQHLEGGPEAQLFIQHGDFIVEQFGSFETGFNENDDNQRAWAIPNIIAVTPLKPPVK